MIKIQGKLYNKFHIISMNSKDGNPQKILTVFNPINVGHIPVLYFRKPKNISQETFDEIFEIITRKMIGERSENK